MEMVLCYVAAVGRTEWAYLDLGLFWYVWTEDVCWDGWSEKTKKSCIAYTYDVRADICFLVEVDVGGALLFYFSFGVGCLIDTILVLLLHTEMNVFKHFMCISYAFHVHGCIGGDVHVDTNTTTEEEYQMHSKTQSRTTPPLPVLAPLFPVARWGRAFCMHVHTRTYTYTEVYLHD